MENHAESGYAGAESAKRVTPGDVVVVLSFFAAFVALYLLSYPLADISRDTILSVFLGSTASLFYTVLGLISVLTIIKYKDNLSIYEVVLAVLLATIVCMAIETNYWASEWNFFHPNYDVYFSGIVTFLMTLGGLAMLKKEQVLHFRIAEENFGYMARSQLLGWIIGLPLAAVNILYFALIEKLPWAAGDIFSGIIISAWPSIMEGIAGRLLVMGLILVVLGRYLPKNLTIATSLLAGAFLIPAVNASGQLMTTPIAALAGVIAFGLLFGLPMALLAYYRDIESAIGAHWIIGFIQYTLGY